MARSEIIAGSWFNTGYHGHYRSQSRRDFPCEYRHLAKPIPPKQFVKRSTEGATKHVFSRHDNKHSFKNDALYFEEGLGRRRIRNNTNHYQPDLLKWQPDRQEYENPNPVMSLYKVDYHERPANLTFKQKIVTRPLTSFDDSRGDTTQYRYSHCTDNPNREVLSAMSNTGLSATPGRKQKGSFMTGRESVATCLNWYTAPPPKSIVPAATQTWVSDEGTSKHVKSYTVMSTPNASAPCTHSTSETITDLKATE